MKRSPSKYPNFKKVLAVFKYNQQDATLHNLFISVKYSTCFRRFLRPSSGAQILYIQHRVLCQTFTATCHCRGRDGTASRFDKVPDAVYTVFELLMMGRGTA